MPGFDDFLSSVRKKLTNLVKRNLQDHRDEAIADGKEFLEKARADLERWTGLLAEGKLSRDDFEWLVAGKKDLAELTLLKQKGLAQVRVDRFKNGLLDIVIDTAVDTFLPG